MGGAQKSERDGDDSSPILSYEEEKAKCSISKSTEYNAWVLTYVRAGTAFAVLHRAHKVTCRDALTCTVHC